MARGRRRLRDDLPQTAEINVTSLVDVAFTLLVIFIITAPILQGGVDVNLPQADVRPLSAIEDYAIVTIHEDGSVALEETPMTLAEFEASFAQFAEAAGTQHLLIRADAAAEVEPTVRVIVAAQKLGMATSFIVDPRPADGGR